MVGNFNEYIYYAKSLESRYNRDELYKKSNEDGIKLLFDIIEMSPIDNSFKE